MNWLTISILCLAASMWLHAAPQTADKAEVAYKAALEKEVADGDLKFAIAQYERLARGSNRAVAAKALVRMGQCYEKLGSAEARKAYERAIREFAEQKDAALQARARLAALGGAAGTSGSEVVARRLWSHSGWGGMHVHDVSSDGRFLVVSKGSMASGGIHTVSVDSNETRGIVPSINRDSWFIRLSPDGQQIAYLSFYPYPRLSEVELHLARLDGKGRRVFTSKELKGEVRVPGGLYDWSPDGKALLMKTRSAGESEDTMILFSPADGSVRRLGPGARFGASRFSPDGRHIASERGRWPSELDSDILLYPVDDPGKVAVVAQAYSPVWTPDGKRLFFISHRRGPKDLWAVRVVDGKPEGMPELVRENFDGIIRVTRDGEIFHSSTVETHGIYTIEFDPLTGRPVTKAQKATEGSNHAGPAWSPDGESMAYYSEHSGPELDGTSRRIMIRALATGKDRTVAPSVALEPTLSRLQWFPDGRTLLVHPQFGRQAEKLARVDVLTGNVEWLLNGTKVQSSGNRYGAGATLSPDGKMIYHTVLDPAVKQVRVVRHDLTTAQETVLSQMEGTRGTEPAVSPDGQRLAVWIQSAQNSAPALFLIPASGGEPSLLRVTGGILPQRITAWSRDGKRIFFNGKQGTPAASTDIWSVPVEGGEAAPLQTGFGSVFSFDLHPDGRRLAFYDEQIRFELWSLKNLLGSASPASR